MTDPAFLDRSGTRLAYRFRPGAGPAVVFLPGYMSDMTGTKAEALDAWAERSGRAFLRLDYSGCGASGGDFAAGTISRWTADAAAVIAAVCPGPAVLVGSSMGAWLALRLAVASPQRAVVTLAGAPDFTDWGLTDAERAVAHAAGFVERPSLYGGAIPLLRRTDRRWRGVPPAGRADRRRLPGAPAPRPGRSRRAVAALASTSPRVFVHPTCR